MACSVHIPAIHATAPGQSGHLCCRASRYYLEQLPTCCSALSVPWFRKLTIGKNKKSAPRLMITYVHTMPEGNRNPSARVGQSQAHEWGLWANDFYMQQIWARQ